MKSIVQDYLKTKLGVTTDPILLYSVLDIDKKEIIAEVWSARNDFEWVKVSSSGVVLEHYRRQSLPDGILFRSYALDSMKEIEFYRMQGEDRLTKYDTETGQELGFTQDPPSIPKSFLEKLDADQIQRLFYWAEKPYGRVVGLTPPK